MKPTNTNAQQKVKKKKKKKKKKTKKEGGDKAKSKSQDCCITFKPKNSKFCFLRIRGSEGREVYDL